MRHEAERNVHGLPAPAVKNAWATGGVAWTRKADDLVCVCAGQTLGRDEISWATGASDIWPRYTVLVSGQVVSGPCRASDEEQRPTRCECEKGSSRPESKLARL